MNIFNLLEQREMTLKQGKKLAGAGKKN